MAGLRPLHLTSRYEILPPQRASSRMRKQHFRLPVEMLLTFEIFGGIQPDNKTNTSRFSPSTDCIVSNNAITIDVSDDFADDDTREGGGTSYVLFIYPVEQSL